MSEHTPLSGQPTTAAVQACEQDRSTRRRNCTPFFLAQLGSRNFLASTSRGFTCSPRLLMAAFAIPPSGGWQSLSACETKMERSAGLLDMRKVL